MNDDVRPTNIREPLIFNSARSVKCEDSFSKLPSLLIGYFFPGLAEHSIKLRVKYYISMPFKISFVESVGQLFFDDLTWIVA